MAGVIQIPSLLSVDPGLRHLGVSLFLNGELQWARLVRNPEKAARGLSAWRSMAEALRPHLPSEPVSVFLSEHQQVYRGRLGGDPDDLLALAGVNGALSVTIEAREYALVLPRVWKGQTPKDVMVKRIWARLSAEELSRVEECPESLKHNVADSVGISLWKLGRIR